MRSVYSDSKKELGKFCLLKIYLDYRELMITGWLTADGWLRLMNTTDWKKKITRENFWTLKFLHSLNFFHSWSSLPNSFQPLPDEEHWGSIYRRGFGIEILLNLQSWKFLKSITCRDNWSNEVCRGRIVFLFFVRDLKREKFLFTFPFSTLLAK